ncbi:MAG: DUF3990 domain-containing protein [Caldilinea sp. CFX5]|nr:DUF3990 domain-containing protein [Caldilinea sp. CFX5]
MQPNAPGTQGYNRYAYVANNPTTWVDPSGYSVEPLAADLALLGMMYAMRGGLVGILQCALSEECREMKALMQKLGSRGANYVEWTADKLYDAFFAYPEQPRPVDPGLILLSVGVSNVPIWGDLYDLYSGVTGYDPITKQYLAGWERLTNILGVIPIPGVTGSNIRHGVDAIESLIDNGDELAQFIGKACSFDEDTPVATDEGAIPIREIDVGDQVLAWDEVTDATGYYTVTAVWGHEDPVTVQLVVNGETIDTTPEHPFLTVDGDWVAAGALQVGDKVRNAAGENGLVEAVEFAATSQVMYNMTVADAHTYAVGDGQWVVHNACRVFYHGTTSLNAGKIREGIDLSYGRGNLDFDPVGGKGFYVTTDFVQAVEWMTILADNQKSFPSMLEFSVEESKLAALSGKIFTSADEEWARFVIAGRNGTLRHTYDYVEGPMLRKGSLPMVDFSRGILPKSKGHQLAIYTPNAVALFQASLLP